MRGGKFASSAPTIGLVHNRARPEPLLGGESSGAQNAVEHRSRKLYEMVSSRTMVKAAIASVQLARFDRLREPGAVEGPAPGTLFIKVAADTRAAATEPASQQAFAFLTLGLHQDAASAQRFVADRVEWLDEAQEVWCGILEPFRHHGAANYLDRVHPGLLFESMMPADLAVGPVVALTTSGWNVGEGLDMNRVREFGAGVLAVRASMTGVPGLRSQQSFFFPGVLEYDPLTLTFWRDEASIRAFAYGQGSHRRQLERHRAEGLADRTSFTRFHVLSSTGTWYGVDPALQTADPQR
jgi:hypothetical protein